MGRVGTDGGDAAYGAGAGDEGGREGIAAFSGVDFARVRNEGREEDADEGAAWGGGGKGTGFDGERGGGGGDDEGRVGFGELGSYCGWSRHGVYLDAWDEGLEL